ncbi:MAG: UDPGP type 1 family protein [Clostridia bacterium]|jgi:UDP-N-acetylglucosamine/UDP-N-acetylgalactosamine diphosphorylase|nr:UDPGP type 1 family protein [Clostridia bacterium]
MEIEKRLLSHGQEHILRVWQKAQGEEKAALERQIAAIDWDMLGLRESVRPCGKIEPISGISAEELDKRKEELFTIGAQTLREGKLAAVLLAGGQGTRLGSDKPKGAFDMGLTRHLPIFGLLMENLKAACAACSAIVPLAVMTSAKNDGETRAFFKEHGFFGYPEEYVGFFVQDTAACVDFNGKLLLEEKNTLAAAPNGNGGWYTSLVRSGLLEREAFKTVQWFNVFAVDNVLQKIADPVFLGATLTSGCKTGAKVVKKVCPEERVGVLCLENGVPRVVEYYELPSDMANARDTDGELLYRYGVTLNYLFEKNKLEEIAGRGIPVHVVEKKIPYLDERGNKVVPERPNGYKFETLILDLVALMGSCLPCEVVREREFAPVKNAQGVDSVETARALLIKNGVEL